MKKLSFAYYNWDEFERFLDSLPDKDAAKLIVTISKIENYGLLISERQQWVKKLEDNLYEIRSKRGSNIQRAIYFQKVNSQYVITHGFTKKTNKTPELEKRKARKIRDTYLNNRSDKL